MSQIFIHETSPPHLAPLLLPNIFIYIYLFIYLFIYYLTLPYLQSSEEWGEMSRLGNLWKCISVNTHIYLDNSISKSPRIFVPLKCQISQVTITNPFLCFWTQTQIISKILNTLIETVKVEKTWCVIFMYSSFWAYLCNITHWTG